MRKREGCGKETEHVVKRVGDGAGPGEGSGRVCERESGPERPGRAGSGRVGSAGSVRGRERERRGRVVSKGGLGGYKNFHQRG